MSDLADLRCVPCKGGVPPLTRAELAPLTARIDPGWQVVERTDRRGREICLLARDYAFPDFKAAMAFAAAVGEIAEDQAHHPELCVAWGRVRVEIWTHKIGGLTESDAIFAAKCDRAFARAANAR